MSNGKVPDSLQLSEGGGHSFYFTLTGGPITVTAESTNFNDQNTHFVATYAPATEPVVTAKTTPICTDGTAGGTTLTVDVQDQAPVTTLSATWKREVEPIISTPAPEKIVLHEQSANKYSSAPENFYPTYDPSLTDRKIMQSIWIYITGADLFGREISHTIHTTYIWWEPQGGCQPAE
jgi:hypothetical protein